MIAGTFVMLKATMKIGGGSARFFVKQQESLAALNGYIEEMVNGQKVVKVFNHEPEAKQGFNERNDALTMNPNPDLCGSKQSCYNMRLGTQFNFNVSKNLAIGLEIDGNMKNDEFNLKRNFNPDFQLSALLGLTFKFGQPQKKVVEPEPEPVYEAPAPPPAPKPVVKPEPKPEPKPVVKDEPLKEVFFYNIRLSDPDPDAILNRIVSWCNKYPQKGISIKGYADRGTGNPRINVGYAKARAEKVAKALQEKGVDASRMTVESFGDTVQPYDENDKNRCVIVVGE